jgi:hypothetical protein
VILTASYVSVSFLETRKPPRNTDSNVLTFRVFVSKYNQQLTTQAHTTPLCTVIMPLDNTGLIHHQERERERERQRAAIQGDSDRPCKEHCAGGYHLDGLNWSGNNLSGCFQGILFYNDHVLTMPTRVCVDFSSLNNFTREMQLNIGMN